MSSRDSKSFARKAPRISPQEKVLVYCEDTHSSLFYLRKAAQVFRASADVRIAHSGYTDPLGIVKSAIKSKAGYDHIYCVFDRDSHENFNAATALAREHKKYITLIISNPCFEYWHILHFGFTRRPYIREGNRSSGDSAIRELKQKEGMNKYQKGDGSDIFNMLSERLEDAERHAKQIFSIAKEYSEYNPSTEVYKLIEKFRILGKPTESPP